MRSNRISQNENIVTGIVIIGADRYVEGRPYFRFIYCDILRYAHFTGFPITTGAVIK
jgi:hypothetical protein